MTTAQPNHTMSNPAYTTLCAEWTGEGPPPPAPCETMGDSYGKETAALT